MLHLKELCGNDAVLVREVTPGVFQLDDGSNSPDLNVYPNLLPTLLTAQTPATYNGSAGQTALAFPGQAYLTKTSAGAYTLAAPVAGSLTVGGNDGDVIVITSTTAYAHTVTVGAGLINGASAGIATFGGAKGDSVTLQAFNGVWYTRGLIGVVIS